MDLLRKLRQIEIENECGLGVDRMQIHLLRLLILFKRTEVFEIHSFLIHEY